MGAIHSFFYSVYINEDLLCALHCVRLWEFSGERKRAQPLPSQRLVEWVQTLSNFYVVTDCGKCYLEDRENIKGKG